MTTTIPFRSMKLVGTVRQSNPDLFAMQKVLFYLIGLGLCKGQVGNQRGQELTCYECAAKSSNDTCTDEYRKSVKILGFDKRCRIMEMNGKVVSQGVVPKVLCTQNALAKVNKMRQHLHLAGDGEVFPYCCNSDFCNTDMCKAMGLPSGHNLCTTTIEHKLKEQQLIQQPPLKQKPQNGQQAILNANAEPENETPKPVAPLQAAGFGGSLTQKSSTTKFYVNNFMILCAIFLKEMLI